MRVTVRALGLLMCVLLLGAAVEPHVVVTSPSVAQGIHGDPLNVAATPFAPVLPILGGPDGVQPTATPPYPLPTEIALRCPDPAEPVEPVSVVAGATPIALYQPVPHSTG